MLIDHLSLVLTLGTRGALEQRSCVKALAVLPIVIAFCATSEHAFLVPVLCRTPEPLS